MAKATDSEWLLRLLNKFLTLDEYHDRVPESKRVRLAFWKGVGAHKKLLKSKAKAAKKRQPPIPSVADKGN